MSPNLLELAQNYFLGSTVRQVSTAFGEPEGRISAALRSVVPLVLGGLLTRAQQPGGAAELTDWSQQVHKRGLLSDLSGLLGGLSATSAATPATSNLPDRGADMMRALLGADYEPAVASISQQAAVLTNTVSNLFSVAVAAVLGLLGRHGAQHSLDADGVGSYLGSQRDDILSALATLPGGLGQGIARLVPGAAVADIVPALTASSAPAPVADSAPAPVADSAPAPVADIAPAPTANITPAPTANSAPAPATPSPGRDSPIPMRASQVATPSAPTAAPSSAATHSDSAPADAHSAPAAVPSNPTSAATQPVVRAAPPRPAIRPVAPAPAPAVSRRWPWLLLLALGLAVLGYFVLGRRPQVADNEPITTPTVPASPTAPVRQADSATRITAPTGRYEAATDTYRYEVGTDTTLRLPTGTSLTVGSHSTEAQLWQLLTDSTQSLTADKNLSGIPLDQVYFAPGKATLMVTSLAQLANLATLLTAFPHATLKFGGFTDNQGSADANLLLSADRAIAVRRMLVAKGIAPTRIAAQGYGQTHPIASNATPTGQAQNRRVAVLLTSK